MRIILSIVFFYFISTNCFSQTGNCNPTITIEAGIFPNNADSAFKCPVGACCYTHIKSKDPNLEIISFKLIAYEICNYPDDVVEFDNKGNRFSPASMSLLNKACKGSVLNFSCIKAKNKAGIIYTLKPFSITLQ